MILSRVATASQPDPSLILQRLQVTKTLLAEGPRLDGRRTPQKHPGSFDGRVAALSSEKALGAPAKGGVCAGALSSASSLRHPQCASWEVFGDPYDYNGSI